MTRRQQVIKKLKKKTDAEYDSRTDITGHFESEYDQGFCDGADWLFKLAEKEIISPSLAENQQIVLDYLKEKCDVCYFMTYKPFEAIIRLSMLDPGKTELRVENTIDELTYVQQSHVLEVFSRWAQEQEEG